MDAMTDDTASTPPEDTPATLDAPDEPEGSTAPGGLARRIVLATFGALLLGAVVLPLALDRGEDEVRGPDEWVPIYETRTSEAALYAFMQTRMDQYGPGTESLLTGDSPSFEDPAVRLHRDPRECWYEYVLEGWRDGEDGRRVATVRLFEYARPDGPGRSATQEITLVGTSDGWRVESLGPLGAPRTELSPGRQALRFSCGIDSVIYR